jgi:hypothetical protein
MEKMCQKAKDWQKPLRKKDGTIITKREKLAKAYQKKGW